VLQIVTITGSPLSKTATFTLRVLTPAPFNVTCSVNPTIVLINQPVTWEGVASGGIIPYDNFSWTGAVIGADAVCTTVDLDSENPNHRVCSFTSPGTKISTVSANDDVSPPITDSCTTEVKVVSLPIWIEIPP